MTTTFTYGDLSYDIYEHIGVLGTYGDGYKRECNLVAWNGNPAKVDIRDWNEDHTKMTRGITITEDVAETMTKALTEYLKSDDRFDTESYVPEPINTDQVVFVILDHVGVIKHIKDSDWRKEINIVSWNGGPAKFDIRDWSQDHQRMARGLTMTVAEIEQLTELLNKRYKTTA